MQKRKGMTMIMMLIFVPIILIVAASYVEPIIRSFRAAVNDQKTLLAKSVADSMFEIALWESRGGGTGSVTSGCICDSPPCDEPDSTASNCNSLGIDFGFGQATGAWYVFGTPEVDSDHLIVEGSNEWYTVPSLGSGDAGGDYCSTAEPVIDEDMLRNALNGLVGEANEDVIDDVFDWPCHWNKIREGESVVIPLFIEDSAGVVSNPADLGMDRFELRFRAACDPDDLDAMPDYANSICHEGQRYVVEGDDGQTDTVIVLWEIVGDEVDASDVPTGNKIILGPYTGTNIFLQSQIFNGIINNYRGPPNLNIKDSSPTTDNDKKHTETIIQHLNFIQPHLYSHLQMNRPYLNLLVVHTLREDGNPDRVIPYLEYQFKATLDSSDSPISSTSKVVRVDVMVNGGYSETLEKTIALPKPISGFVISQ
ncbi:hypothetical protein ACFL3T_02435 [Patescibacteria group bacterium]